MKAVVLETRGRKAAVLIRDGTVRVVRRACAVGDVIDLEPSAGHALRRWAAAAAAAAVLAAGAGLWVDRNYVACAEISLDVNPSIVYTLNKRDRVLDVRAANAQAQAVVEALRQSDIRFARLSDAVERTMALLEDEGYLSQAQEDYVLVNVSADDADRQARLTDEVEAAMDRARAHDATLEYRIDYSDRQAASEASANGISTGRYALWQESGGDAEGEAGMQAFAEAPVQVLLEPPQGGAPDPDDSAQRDDLPAEGDPSPGQAAPRGEKPAAGESGEAASGPALGTSLRGDTDRQDGAQQDNAQQEERPARIAGDEAGAPDEPDSDSAAQPQQEGPAQASGSGSDASDKATERSGQSGAAQPKRDKPDSSGEGSASGTCQAPERSGKQPSEKRSGKSGGSDRSPGGSGKRENRGRG